MLEVMGFFQWHSNSFAHRTHETVNPKRPDVSFFPETSVHNPPPLFPQWEGTIDVNGTKKPLDLAQLLFRVRPRFFVFPVVSFFTIQILFPSHTSWPIYHFYIGGGVNGVSFKFAAI